MYHTLHHHELGRLSISLHLEMSHGVKSSLIILTLRLLEVVLTRSPGLPQPIDTP